MNSDNAVQVARADFVTVSGVTVVVDKPRCDCNVKESRDTGGLREAPVQHMMLAGRQQKQQHPE